MKNVSEDSVICGKCRTELNIQRTAAVNNACSAQCTNITDGDSKVVLKTWSN